MSKVAQPMTTITELKEYRKAAQSFADNKWRTNTEHEICDRDSLHWQGTYDDFLDGIEHERNRHAGEVDGYIGWSPTEGFLLSSFSPHKAFVKGFIRLHKTHKIVPVKLLRLEEGK